MIIYVPHPSLLSFCPQNILKKNFLEKNDDVDDDNSNIEPCWYLW